MDEIVSCQTCGLVQRMEPPPVGACVTCARCNFVIHRASRIVETD